ncbi:MAG: glycosyltransferase family 2 protein [Lentisphaeria bacterium]
MRPDICLLFLNFRTARLTAAAARSAAAGTAVPGRLRLLVVDNGSGDGSAEQLPALLPPGAELLVLPANLGFARAVNAGLDRVGEPLVLVCNSDIEFGAGAIDRLADALEADSTAALACPRLLRPDGSEQAAVVPEPRLFWELTNRSLARRLLRYDRQQTGPVPSVVGPCMAVRLDRLAAAGAAGTARLDRLDGRFFFFFEETDWCRRLRAAGRRILYVPAAAVIHLQGESANRTPARARIQFYESRYRYFHKHGGAAAVVLLFVGLWLRLTVDLPLQALASLAGNTRRLAVTGRLWLWHALLCRPRWSFEPPGWK